MTGWMGRINTPQGTVRLWVTELDGKPYEAYMVLGKAGSDLTALAEGIGRMVSIALRSGIPVEIIIDQLKGIGGSRSVGFGPNRVTSRARRHRQDAPAPLLPGRRTATATTAAAPPAARSAPVGRRAARRRPGQQAAGRPVPRMRQHHADARRRLQEVPLRLQRVLRFA